MTNTTSTTSFTFCRPFLRPNSIHCPPDQRSLWTCWPIIATSIAYILIVQSTWKYRSSIFKDNTWQISHPGTLLLLLHYNVLSGSVPVFLAATLNKDSDDVELSTWAIVNGYGEANFYVSGITQFYLYWWVATLHVTSLHFTSRHVTSLYSTSLDIT